MVNFWKFIGIAAVMLVALSLSACGDIQTGISFSTPYQQPTSGERARLRVMSFGGMVRAVPNSSCIDWRLPGAGVMVVPTKGFANVNGQDLGMPVGQFPGITTAMGTVAVSELYIPAGKPIVLHYLSQGEIHGRTNYQCFVPRSFVPIAGEDYEAMYFQEGSLCRFGIARLTKSEGVDTSSSVALVEAPLCRASDNF